MCAFVFVHVRTEKRVLLILPNPNYGRPIAEMTSMFNKILVTAILRFSFSCHNPIRMVSHSAVVLVFFFSLFSYTLYCATNVVAADSSILLVSSSSSEICYSDSCCHEVMPYTLQSTGTPQRSSLRQNRPGGHTGGAPPPPPPHAQSAYCREVIANQKDT